MKKRILITGKDSYIGTSFESWMRQFKDRYFVDTIDTIGEEWERTDFSQYDIVFHVAGIAHVDIPRNKSGNYNSMQDLYYRVNRDLTLNIAKKAKSQGVKQFIFMSSIIVYGESSNLLESKIITKDTKPNPTNFYGDSKLQAENGLLELETPNFKIAILRPPMIYGKGSKGNYPRLAKLAKTISIFPKFDNKRSMLHIDNLCEFIHYIIDDDAKGIFFPQNQEYVNTSELVYLIGRKYGKNVRLTNKFNFVLVGLSRRIKLINKVFGSLAYDKEMSSYPSYNYCIRDLKQSIELTEE